MADQLTVRAIDQLSGEAIKDSVLSLPAAGRRGLSDASGWITVDDLEPGIYEAMLEGPGYHSRMFRIEISPEQPTYREVIILTPIVHDLAAFEVSTSLTSEDQDALEQRRSVTPMNQISGEDLQDINNQDLGDALTRIAGVNVDTEEGNISGINIRGAGPKQTRVTLDGQSVAGGGGRGTTRGAGAMNQIPKEFLDRIQIMKAPTPDMDADAIGGTIDLQTSRIAKSKNPRSSISARSSYRDADNEFSHRLSVAHAQPFQLSKSDRRFGILLAVSLQESESNPDDIRVNRWLPRTSPDSGEQVHVLSRLRTGTRIAQSEGYGLVLNTDLQLNKNNQFQLKGMWNSRESRQSSQFQTFDFLRGNIVSLSTEGAEFSRMRMEKQLMERTQTSESGSMVFAGEHKINDWIIDESIGISFANSESAGTQNGTFRTNRNYDGSYDLKASSRLPAVSILKDGLILDEEAIADASAYSFIRYDLLDDWADDEEIAMRINATRKWDSDEAEWIFRAGGKARIRDASKDQDKLKYSSDNAFGLDEVIGTGDLSVYRGIYPIGANWSADAMAGLFETRYDEFILDELDALLDASAGDFSVSESIYATYGMIQRESKNWILISGVRLERTESETRGFETISRVDENGERIIKITPVSISDSYDRVFPGAHFLYRPNSKLILRASVTRTLQRPDFRDLSPSIRVNLDTKRIRAGNPDLEPFDAKAVDFGADFVLNQYGSVSLGIFYKRIDDFIVDIEEEIEYLDEPGFLISRPVNGSPAEIVGVEAAWSTLLAFLPGALDTTSLNLNYTFTDSTAAYPGYDGVIVMLPKQVRQTFNLSLRWKLNNWTLSLRTRYRGLQLNDLTEPGQDIFTAAYWAHSASLSYAMNDTISFSLGMSNLNRPDRMSYQGIPEQPTSVSEGTRVFSIGLNMKFGKGKLATGIGNQARGTEQDESNS